MIEKILYRLAELTYPEHKEGQRINIGPIPSFLARDKALESSTASDIERLRKIRSQIVHGQIEIKSVLTDDLMMNIQHILSVLEELLSDIMDKKEKGDA
ncbi:MAG: hypothetical protein NTX30_04075 [Deltaproteobacteria bacterium]|nr:hypothetical protein [Deltaproteobacteria bacterium]